MLKLLTKFKTQSLNEVKPYDNTASFVACGGETRSEAQSVEKNPLHLWPHDSGRIGEQKTTSSALVISRPQNGELTKTLHWSAGDTTVARTVYFKYDNKENGEYGRDFSSCSFKRHNGVSASVAEKRKWSDIKKQRNFTKHVASGGDSSSSDDEIRELFTKQPKSDSLNTSRGIKVRPRRHRTITEDRFNRPSLDFEKMQQKVVWKRSCNSRPRIVKVRSFAGHSHHMPILMKDASIVSFQPIQTIKPYKMTPVEETQALVY